MVENAAEVRGYVNRIKTLPTMPGVVKQLCGLMESDDTTTTEIAEMIATDQVLSAKVLKIVNSPFYGFPGRIATINHAVVLLGFNVVKGIVLSAAILGYMTAAVKGLWEHSLGTAVTAGALGRTLGLKEPEELATAGLLHDLGKVLLSVEMKSECAAVIQKVKKEKVSFIEAEQEILFGVNHCTIAGWLAEEWNLPPRLAEPLTRHHRPDKAGNAAVATAVVHLADICTRALQFGSGGDPYVPAIQPEAMEMLDLKMADMPGLLEVIDDELEDIDTRDFL